MRVMIAYFGKLAGVSAGLEHICCEMANEMIERGHAVCVVNYEVSRGSPYYDLKSDIQLVNLMYTKEYSGAKSDVALLGRKIGREIFRIFGHKMLRYWEGMTRDKDLFKPIIALNQQFCPDIIVSFSPETNGILYRAGIKVPIIGMFCSDPDILCQSMTRYEINAYNMNAAVQVLTPLSIDKAKKYISNKKIVCIPNPIWQAQKTANLSVQKSRYSILHVGRINGSQKRQHLLIEAFARIAEKFPEWDVYLWGPESRKRYVHNLKHLIHSYNLENRIFLKGTTHNLSDVYSQADIFCFPSAYEGFGMALAEAMSAGLPAIGFKSCSGVNEIITHDFDGLLVDDGPEALAEGMCELMSNTKKRISMGNNASESMKKFDPLKIWDQWDFLFHQVTSDKNNYIESVIGHDA